MHEAATRRTLGHRLRHATPLILAVALATALLEHFEFFNRFENLGLDVLTSFARGEAPDHVVIVAINEQEYHSVFGGTSPLDPYQLAVLMDDIARDRPAAIGVDLDTSAPPFRDFVVPEAWPPVVWSATARWDGPRHVFAEVIPALGGRGATRPQDQQALALFPEDADGVIRWSRRRIHVEGTGELPSLAWALVARADDEAAPHDQRGVRLNFTRHQFNFTPLSITPIKQLMEAGGAPGARGVNGPLTGKIVLVGGSYAAARDEHRTPVGTWQGVQVVAQAIETELHGGGIHTLQHWLAVTTDIAVGYALVWLNYTVIVRSRRETALRNVLLAGLAAAVVLPMAASAITFLTVAFWFNFVPIVVSVLVHEFYEHAREYQRLAAEHGIEA